jgi:hypothetical protein
VNRIEDPFELSRSATPPGNEGVYWVECLKGDDKQKFLVYSPEVQGVNMHWRPAERKTVPCFVNTAYCPGGHSEKTRKWRCYVFAHSYRKHKPVFVQLTKDAWTSWLHQLKPGANMRGSTINVCRSAKDNGRLWVEVESWREERQKDLPQNEDCKISIFSMWKFEAADVMADAKLASEVGFSKNGRVYS